MIKGMLVKNPKKRISIIELLVSKWIKKYCNLKTKPKYISIEATKSLMMFNSERKLEQALKSYLTNKISMDKAGVKLI